MSEALGKPGVGIHAERFLGIAFWDLFFTIVGSVLVSYLSGAPLSIVLWVILTLGFFLHWLFDVKTSSRVYLRADSGAKR